MPACMYVMLLLCIMQTPILFQRALCSFESVLTIQELLNLHFAL